MNKYFLTLIVVLITLLGNAQKKNESFQLNIRKTTSPVTIDGVVDEQAWKEADATSDFYMVTPMDTSLSKTRTEVRMTYDDQYIYMVAICYNSMEGPYFVESLRRDFSFGQNDNFLVAIDPFHNQTTGFAFGANAAGAQWDGTMSNGNKVDLNWDNKWISEVKQDDEKWVFEMAIPFKTIRYKQENTEWGINFSRLDLKASEKSSWAPVPRQFPSVTLAYAGILVWDAPPPSPGTNISLIPFVSGAATRDIDTSTDTYQGKIGGDVKVGLTSSLSLDLTVNPDFSQVDVDRQVTNLDRFELYFPEKRQFFLENADLFSNFGYDKIRPFFSRRVGLSVPIQAGARVSGNLNENWRIGAMDMQTSSIAEEGLPSQNFGILSLQRKVFSRSSIGLLYVNKESINYPQRTDSLLTAYPQYNRNLGLEYNLASSDNLWTGKAFFLKSFSPFNEGNGYTQAAHIEYKSHNWNWLIKEESVEKNYSAEVGYVPRNGYNRLTSSVSHSFFTKGGAVVSHGPGVSTSYYFNENMKRTDNLNLVHYNVNFRNRSNFKLIFIDEYVELLSSFDPTKSDKDTLSTGTKHNWNAMRFNFSSKPQSLFTYAFSGRVGGYYQNGTWASLSSELGYRFQPYVSLRTNVSYNNIQLPAPWNLTEFWLIGAQLDITFTNKLFFVTLFQYNEQSENFNLNSRFQWRYKPASDLFIVYTDSYLISPIAERVKSLTLKFTYWFNL